jgi:hypothetical protein
MIGMTIGVALARVVFVEIAFGLPGLGGMLRQSIMRRDLPITRTRRGLAPVAAPQGRLRRLALRGGANEKGAAWRGAAP